MEVKRNNTRSVNQSWITYISMFQSPPLKSGINLLHYTKPSKEQKTTVLVPDEPVEFLRPSAEVKPESYKVTWCVMELVKVLKLIRIFLYNGCRFCDLFIYLSCKLILY